MSSTKLYPQREAALAASYELYTSMPGHKKAARGIDRSISKAAKATFDKLASGRSLYCAMCISLKELVAPVMAKYRELGSGDTEPEWLVVYVFKEQIESRLGCQVEVDNWDLRGNL